MEEIVLNHRQQLIENMPLVKSYTSKLDSLNAWWGKIALIGKINSHKVAATILADMEETKEKFGALQQSLIQNLIEENLKKLILNDSSMSQVAIDILIRNLFERTADVGFLATDDDIRAFLANPESDNLPFIENRLNEYVKKYSVYDEIIILDTNGNVRAHLDQQNPVTHCSDPLIRKTLESPDDYLESFCQSDLQPDLDHSLIYSCKITRDNNADSPALGVLCLCFRFDNEMEGIFKNLMQTDHNSTLMILDNTNQVIATSNKNSAGIGSKFTNSNKTSVINHNDNEYFSTSTKTNGYQGFYGLDWSGQILTPTSLAFLNDNTSEIDNLNEYALEKANLFSSELVTIRKNSVDINEDLSLVVLNGKITAARKKAIEFMPVLEAIKDIGEGTANIFNDSIHNLLTTVISSGLDDVRFMAALAVDIMDRNLYERANDCRWWALTSAFRGILSAPAISDEDNEAMSAILTYINDLYTVYTNLYLYDQSGKILAVSNPAEKHIIGTHLDENTGATRALQISDSQQYTVSPFTKTELYANRHTYIFNSPITDMNNSRKTVGGIGIVFDSEPEFEAMLSDSLPRNENGKLDDGCFAVLTDRKGFIISCCNNPQLQAGSRLNVKQRYFTIENGAGISELMQYKDNDYLLGMAASKGYREYKTTGDHDNDVLAFVFVRF